MQGFYLIPAIFLAPIIPRMGFYGLKHKAFSIIQDTLIMSTELQQLNGQNKVALWAERISECRNSSLSVKTWCKEKGVCEQTYYKWQKKIFAMAQAQQELQFAEVTPVMTTNSNCQIAVSIHAGGVAANIHNGADPTTVESVLRILKLC